MCGFILRTAPSRGPCRHPRARIEGVATPLQVPSPERACGGGGIRLCRGESEKVPLAACRRHLRWCGTMQRDGNECAWGNWSTTVFAYGAMVLKLKKKRRFFSGGGGRNATLSSNLVPWSLCVAPYLSTYIICMITNWLESNSSQGAYCNKTEQFRAFNYNMLLMCSNTMNRKVFF